jgi:hypothetical protein
VTTSTATGAKAAGEAAATGVRVAGKEAVDIVADITGGLIKRDQSPAKQEIARILEGGGDDMITAKFLLDPPTAPAQSALGRALQSGAPTVSASPEGVAAIKQGFDEAFVAIAKGASKADKKAIGRMLDEMEAIKKNPREAIDRRPSNVVGDLLGDKFNIVLKANKQAGKKIGKVVKSLKNEPVDIIAPIVAFEEGLNDLGINLTHKSGGGRNVNFDFSRVPPGDRAPIREAVRVMNLAGEDITAFKAHEMKKVLDNNITYGKVKTGLSGDGEKVLREFRKGLDSALDSTFPAYNEANTVFAGTIKALDAFQEVMGKKIDLTTDSGRSSIGTMTRRITSQAQTRGRVTDAAKGIQAAADKYGGALDDALKIEGEIDRSLINDLPTQIVALNALERTFGAVGVDTGFLEQVGQGVKRGVTAAATGSKFGIAEGGVKVADALKSRKINEKEAIKAMRDLLK